MDYAPIAQYGIIRTLSATLAEATRLNNLHRSYRFKPQRAGTGYQVVAGIRSGGPIPPEMLAS